MESEPVDVKNAVEMVGFVLEDDGRESADGVSDGPDLSVLSFSRADGVIFDDDFCRAGHIFASVRH